MKKTIQRLHNVNVGAGYSESIDGSRELSNLLLEGWLVHDKTVITAYGNTTRIIYILQREEVIMADPERIKEVEQKLKENQS